MFLSTISEQEFTLYLLLFNLDFLEKLLFFPLAFEIIWVYVSIKDIHFVVDFCKIVLFGLLLFQGQINFIATFGFEVILVFVGFVFGTIENG